MGKTYAPVCPDAENSLKNNLFKVVARREFFLIILAQELKLSCRFEATELGAVVDSGGSIVQPYFNGVRFSGHRIWALAGIDPAVE